MQIYLLVTLEVAIAILMPVWEMGELEPAVKPRSTDCCQTSVRGTSRISDGCREPWKVLKRMVALPCVVPLVSINVVSHCVRVTVSALYLATSVGTSRRGGCLAARDAPPLLALEMEKKEEKL